MRERSTTQVQSGVTVYIILVYIPTYSGIIPGFYPPFFELLILAFINSFPALLNKAFRPIPLISI